MEKVHQLYPTLEARAAQAMVDYASGKVKAIHAVIEYGKALLEGRENRNDKQFGAWVVENKLNIGKPWEDRFERAKAMQIAEIATVGKVPTVSFDACPNSRPTDIMKWYREQTAPKTDDEKKSKSSKSSGKSQATPKTDAAYDTIVAWLASGKKISNQRTFADERRNIASHAMFETAFDRLKQERARNATAKANEDSALAKAEAGFSDKSKVTLEKATQIHKARLDKVFETKVGEKVREHIAAADEAMRKENAKLRKDNMAITMLLRQEAIFTADEYKTILRCLHPDNSASTDVRSRAFDLVKQKEKRLVGIS